jgi:transposase
MEACATSHHWARELTKLGHEVRLMPAKDVKAYVKRNKNDAADAEAICEAVRRPTMRFVTVKTVEQQGRLMQHRVRDQLMRQRTQLINALRSHMAELGIAAAQGREGLKDLLAIVTAEHDGRLPVDAKASLMVLAAHLQACQTMIGMLEKRILAQHKSSDVSRRLETIPGIGVVGATTIAAIVSDPKAFRSGRDFAAWIGLVPRQDSTGGKQKLGHISKQGDRYLRRILVVGAHAVLRRARQQRHVARLPRRCRDDHLEPGTVREVAALAAGALRLVRHPHPIELGQRPRQRDQRLAVEHDSQAHHAARPFRYRQQ